MNALLLAPLALADCPPLVTVPEDGEEDVPPGLQVMMVGPPTAVGHDWGLCEPESVTVLDEARNEAVVLDESWQGDAFQLSQLEPETDYTVTLEQPSTEPTVVRFRTGAPRDATPVPTPVRIDSRAWLHGEEVCAEITGQVSGADRWMIIRSNVGTPQPWIRATEADQTVTLSTLDAHRPVWARGQGCGGDRMTEAPVRVSVFRCRGSDREVSPQPRADSSWPDTPEEQSIRPSGRETSPPHGELR